MAGMQNTCIAMGMKGVNKEQDKQLYLTNNIEWLDISPYSLVFLVCILFTHTPKWYLVVKRAWKKIPLFVNSKNFFLPITDNQVLPPMAIIIRVHWNQQNLDSDNEILTDLELSVLPDSGSSSGPSRLMFVICLRNSGISLFNSSIMKKSTSF